MKIKAVSRQSQCIAYGQSWSLNPVPAKISNTNHFWLSASEISLAVYISQIFPVSQPSDPCMLTANMTSCDHFWEPAQKKKIPGLSHQLQNPTSTETRYYCRFSVSYDSKNNNVFLFSEAFIVKQRNLRGTVLIFTKTTESYISLTGINLFYFTSKEGLTLNGNNYLHINDKFTLFYSVCKMC